MLRLCESTEGVSSVCLSRKQRHRYYGAQLSSATCPRLSSSTRGNLKDKVMHSAGGLDPKSRFYSLKRNDEEAVVDRGGTRSMLKTNFEKEELEGHSILGYMSPWGGRATGDIDITDTDTGREAGSGTLEWTMEENLPHTTRPPREWLKFEEDVEDGGERWSKPYVATLSLHSLFELRSCILNGVVLLDMRANSVEEVADMVLDQQETVGPLGDEVRRKVRETLLKQHHHQNQKKLANRIPIVRSFADKKQSEPHSMDKNGQVIPPQTSLPIPNDGKAEIDLHFMKKIPPGAEASNVLVGEAEFLDKPVVAFVRPLGKGPQYHEIGRSIATLMTDEVFHDVAYKAKDRNDLIAGIDEFLDQVTVLPPGEWDPSIRIEPPKNVPSQVMKRSTRDMVVRSCSGQDDALSLQCLASFLFLYCACMSPVITFGATHHIGQHRACAGGVRIILPLTENLYRAVDSVPLSAPGGHRRQLPGLCSCVEPPDPSNATLRYWEQNNITASEIYWEALEVKDCIKRRGEFVGSACGLHGPYIPDVLFWSVVLFFSTVFMSAFLKEFKFSRYFPTKLRAVISDFAVFITIFTMVLMDYALGVPSPKLKVPSVFKPTRDDRGWLISPLGGNPWWTTLVTVIPALLCTILIFMDQQITAVIINRKEHKLKKGCGYHLDLFVVGIMLGVCSIMGLPWFVAATVLSISHVNSLKLESECSAPGEQPKFLGIREQRFTGLMIFLLMGCSVFMTSVLKYIPMPVLYGVFLYMGASSLRGIQFFDRLKLFGMPAKHQPDFIYLRYVPMRKVHLFTIIQLSCLVMLWVIKTSNYAIVFPMMEEAQSMLGEEEGVVQLPLEGYQKSESALNITDEMSKGSFGNTWNVNSNNSKKELDSKSLFKNSGRKQKKRRKMQKGCFDRETSL
ncbi:unnamed protein product [Coregonus sp. 'balchen']|nr:unnamed protein product [Coregonus sp. 'balchen']